MSVLATDDFNRANNADLGANWTPISDGNSGGDNFTITSNAAVSTGPDAADCCEGYTGISWPNDQWSEVTYGTAGADALGAGDGPCVRTVAGTPSTFDYYRLIASGAGWELGKFVDGAFTSIASGAGTTWADGDRAYLEVQGTTLIVKKNTTNGAGGTTVTTQTDSSIASGNPGIAHSTSDTASKIDSWQGGDFVAGGTTSDPIPRMRFYRAPRNTSARRPS